ncbi:MAG: tetratricopeptide repeat protein [Pseudolabrys sp.]
MASTRGLRAFQNARARKKNAETSGAPGGAANADTVLAHALTLHRAGQVGQAKLLYQQILSLAPERFDALMFLAVAEYQGRNLDEAERLFRRAIAANPRSPEVHSNFSLVFSARGDFQSALAECDKALALMPGFADAHCNRANALRALGRKDEALAAIDRAVALKPDSAQAHNIRGSLLHDLRRSGEAVASYDRAIAINPGLVEALSHRAAILYEAKNFDAALDSYDRILSLAPDVLDARLARAKILHRKQRIDEAVGEYIEILSRRPDDCEILTLLGQCEEARGNVDATLSYYDRALAIQPDFVHAVHNRIYAIDFSDRVDEAGKQAARAHWWQHIGAKIADRYGAFARRFDNVRDPDRRIVVGYVSADFRKHSVAVVFRPVLRLHDHSRFEVVCYSNTPNQDEWTSEFRQIADRWHDVSQWTDDRLTEQIIVDRVDILVDLSGHSAGHRLEVFARKPAPIQVTAWGNATGSGIPAFDYLFSDPVAVPPEARHLFAEEIYDLPCAISIEQIDSGPSSDPPSLSQPFTTYGVFNRVNKISDQALDAWAALLRADPAARLAVKHSALDDETVRQRLTQQLLARGVSGERIALRGETNREDHLDAIRKVDICLDTFPYNGGVSCWEPLSVGVPVISTLGRTVANRISASILTSIGMQEWVATDVETYIAIAQRLAAAPERLKALRSEIPRRIAQSQSGNNAAYTKSVETAYRTMWQDYCRQNG